MLRPQQVEDYAQRCAAAFDELELNILTDMARRIAKANYMTEGAKWQAERAEALGASRKHLADRMEKLMADAAPHVAVIFAQAMLEAEEQDNRFYRAAGQQEPEGIGTSSVAQQIAQSGYRRTMNTLYNLTQTRALMNNHNLPVAVQNQLARILDQGHMGAVTGAFSTDQIVRQGIKELAAEGVDAITYPSSHTDKLEVVVLRAMRTGINQTAMDISRNNALTMGVDIMELTAHGGARTGDGQADFTNHSWWQGKLVSLSGQPGYLTLEDIGYGDVRGFAGANCRHNWHPFWPGISKPAYTQEMLDDYNAPKFPYNGQMLTEEQADRRQRTLERQIRRWKREYVLAKETGQTDLQNNAAGRLAAARGRLDDFLQQTGRQKQQLRETVPGFGRSEASSAVWAARRQADPFQEFKAKYAVQNHEDQLPGYENAVIPDSKIQGYVLNLEHPTGGPKAVAFRDVLGYTKENAAALVAEIRHELPRWKATARNSTKYGQPYEVRMLLRGSNGRQATVKTGWIQDFGSNAPRLTSAYIYKEKG